MKLLPPMLIALAMMSAIPVAGQYGDHQSALPTSAPDVPPGDFAPVPAADDHLLPETEFAGASRLWLGMTAGMTTPFVTGFTPRTGPVVEFQGLSRSASIDAGFGLHVEYRMPERLLGIISSLRAGVGYEPRKVTYSGRVELNDSLTIVAIASDNPGGTWLELRELGVDYIVVYNGVLDLNSIVLEVLAASEIGEGRVGGSSVSILAGLQYRSPFTWRRMDMVMLAEPENARFPSAPARAAGSVEDNGRRIVYNRVDLRPLAVTLRGGLEYTLRKTEGAEFALWAMADYLIVPLEFDGWRIGGITAGMKLSVPL